METIVATVVVIGVLIFVHELGHFLVAKYFGVGVEAFSLGFPPTLLHKKIGETDYRLSFLPLGGYVKLVGENPRDPIPPELLPKSFSHRPLKQRTAIVAAGPLSNLGFAVVALSLIFTFSGKPYFSPKVGGVLPDSPAAAIGLQPGDLIRSINGQPVQRWEDVSRLVRGAGEQPLRLQVQRGEEELELTVVPKLTETTNIFGEKVAAPLIGISAPDNFEIERLDPLTAWVHGVISTYRLVELTALSFAKLITGSAPTNSLGGPVMIAQVAGKQAQQGLVHLVHFMAVLSVNLALINLFPIPILDGGHLLFFLVEGIRGKPVAMKHREIAQAIGLTLILVLMFFVFYQDILRLLGPQ